jgi:hypothetical protein
MLKRGDRVIMKDDAADRMNRNFHRFDWRNRRGVLHHISRNKQAAVVFWDGRSSVDLVPVKFVEAEHETKAD